MFFDNWYGIVRILIVGVFAYVALIAGLRIFGKRTLSKWNAFDLIVTVAFGSTLATVIVSKDTVLLEGVAAFLLLVVLQFVITWLSVRLDWAENLVKSTPSMVFDDGKFKRETMLRERVAEAEIRAAIRSQGIAAVEDVEAVVLETDGSLSVVQKSADGSRSALEDVV